jgi:hypothetical protein
VHPQLTWRAQAQIEQQKGIAQRATAANQAQNRVHKVRADHEQRVMALEKAAAAAERCARVIEANLDAVNNVIAALNAQLATGMAWQDLERLIADERGRGAPLAMMIAGLRLEENQATLLLDDWLGVEERVGEEERGRGSDDESGKEGGVLTRVPKVRAQVDLTMNAYSNAKCAPFEPMQSMSAALLMCVSQRKALSHGFEHHIVCYG